MRNIFFEELKMEMRKNDKLFLLVADMGLGLVEPLQQEFSARVLNVGIAEQNMIGVAAGLCNAGFRPICYTISNFLVERSFEQVRNDICLHHYPVTLVGTSTGYDNGSLGPTHHVVDDIGCMKVLPGMTIYSPACVTSIKRTFQAVMEAKVPAYVRIGKGTFKWDKTAGGLNYMAVDGPVGGVLVVTHGNIFENCVKAAEAGDFSLYCVNKVHPLDRGEWAALFQNYERIVVVEDHLRGSGLYNSLCQVRAELKDVKAEISVLAPPDVYSDRIGDKNYFAQCYGLTADQIKTFVNNVSA
ncbi:MAG: hypothetical protein HQL19_05615 [Candidatus Omnitrophica bacterium]|nr:hypothetical protein [Candidatus Omnitrophota bacterium]